MVERFENGKTYRLENEFGYYSTTARELNKKIAKQLDLTEPFTVGFSGFFTSGCSLYHESIEPSAVAVASEFDFFEEVYPKTKTQA